MTDNDRELLELAAKAEGRDLSGYEWTHGAFWVFLGDATFRWSPLVDDGDAFRLMCILDFRVFFFRKHVDVVDWTRSENVIAEHFSSNNPQTKLAALRRAIVRAAAEIGKGE